MFETLWNVFEVYIIYWSIGVQKHSFVWLLFYVWLISLEGPAFCTYSALEPYRAEYEEIRSDQIDFQISFLSVFFPPLPFFYTRKDKRSKCWHTAWKEIKIEIEAVQILFLEKRNEILFSPLQSSRKTLLLYFIYASMAFQYFRRTTGIEPVFPEQKKASSLPFFVFACTSTIAQLELLLSFCIRAPREHFPFQTMHATFMAHGFWRTVFLFLFLFLTIKKTIFLLYVLHWKGKPHNSWGIL